MMLKLKPLIASCAIAFGFCLQAPAVFAQAKVQDISAELWQKLPQGYQVVDCGFTAAPGHRNPWWNCLGYSEGKEPKSFLWLVPVQENGILGQGVLVNPPAREAFSRNSFSALGLQNTLLEVYFNPNPTVVGFAIPPSSANNFIDLKQLWKYSPVSPWGKETNLTVTQAEVLSDSSYMVSMRVSDEDMSTEIRNGFSVVHLGNNGQKIWQYTYKQATPKNLLPDSYEASAILPRKFFNAFGHTTVIYGTTYGSDGDNKTAINTSFLICLTAEGKEMNRQFFKDQYFYKAVQWPELGFGWEGFSFIDTKSDKGEDSYFMLSIFDQDCKQTRNLPLAILPKHGFDRVFNEVKATAMAPSGDLLMVYLQNGIKEGSDDDENLNLYLAQFNTKGELVNDRGIITGQDENKAYLTSGGRDYDPLKTTLGVLEKTNEVLISIHNLGIDSEDDPEKPLNFGRPRIYLIKLP